MKSVSKTTKIAIGAAILAVGGFSGIGLANAAQVSNTQSGTQQAEVTHATPATPATSAVPATPKLPAKPAAPAVPVAPAVPATPAVDGSAKVDAGVEGTKGAAEGSIDADKHGADVQGSAAAKGVAGEAHANVDVHAAVPAVPGAHGVPAVPAVPATPSAELPQLDK